MCRLLGVSKQAYYKHVDKLMFKMAQGAFVVEFVKNVRGKDRGIGGYKLWMMYHDRFGAEHNVGYNRFYDILERHGLKVRNVNGASQPQIPSMAFPFIPTWLKNWFPAVPASW